MIDYLKSHDTMNWLNSWIKTALTLADNGDPVITYLVYRKGYRQGDTVTLGAVNYGSCVNYFAVATA